MMNKRELIEKYRNKETVFVGELEEIENRIYAEVIDDLVLLEPELCDRTIVEEMSK